MSTAAAEPKSTFTVVKDEEGLTAREREVRDLLASGMNQSAIARQIGTNRQRVSEIVGQLRTKSALTPPKKTEPLTKSEWRSISGALRARKALTTQQPEKDACDRALEKARQLIPDGVKW